MGFPYCKALRLLGVGLDVLGVVLEVLGVVPLGRAQLETSTLRCSGPQACPACKSVTVILLAGGVCTGQ